MGRSALCRSEPRVHVSRLLWVRASAQALLFGPYIPLPLLRAGSRPRSQCRPEYPAVGKRAIGIGAAIRGASLEAPSFSCGELSPPTFPDPGRSTTAEPAARPTP